MKKFPFIVTGIVFLVKAAWAAETSSFRMGSVDVLRLSEPVAVMFFGQFGFSRCHG
jgi:hypothetical protein